MTKLTLPKLEPTIGLSLWKDHVGENFDPWKLTCPLSFWPQDTPLNFNISKMMECPTNSSSPLKISKMTPIFVKNLPSNSLGFSPAAFSAANPPALTTICRFTGKVPQLWQGAPLRELETTRRCCYPGPHGVRWKHPISPGKKTSYGFRAGEGFEGFVGFEAKEKWQCNLQSLFGFLKLKHPENFGEFLL